MGVAAVNSAPLPAAEVLDLPKAGVEVAGAATEAGGAPNRAPLGAAVEDAPASAPPNEAPEAAAGVPNRLAPLAPCPPPNKLPADPAAGAAPNKLPPVLALAAPPNKPPPVLFAAGAPNKPPVEPPATCPAPKILPEDPKLLIEPPMEVGAVDVGPEAPNKGCAPKAGAALAVWLPKPKAG